MLINDWAARWGVPDQAINDLLTMVSADDIPTIKPGVSEASVQQRVRLEASRAGARLWRNNNGVAENRNGQPVRYGLANESSKVNSVLKSSDLIGITPHVVTPADVGKTHGIFTAVEVKKQSWKFTGEERETAQLRFILLVLSMGGIAKFNNGVG